MTQYPVRVSPTGDVVAERRTIGPGVTCPWRTTIGTWLSDDQVADWTPLTEQAPAPAPAGHPEDAVHRYPVRVSPDGLDAAVRSRPATFDTDTAPWRSSDGSILSDSQVADWMPYAPAPQLDTTGGPAEVIELILEGAVINKDLCDVETATALRDAIMHGLRIKGFLAEDASPVVATTLAAGTVAALGRVTEFAEHFAIDHSKHDEIVDVSHKRVLRLADLDALLAATRVVAHPAVLTAARTVAHPAVHVFAAALIEWATHWPPRKGDDVTLAPIYEPLGELDDDALQQCAIAASDLSGQAWEVRNAKLRADLAEAARDA